MSSQGDGEGLAEVFVKGVVFTFGAAVAGLVLRRVFGKGPDVVVVQVPVDELARGGRGEGGAAVGLLQQLAVVDAKYFAPARAAKSWPPQSPWEPLPLERAVAELVGEKAPPVVPPEFAYLGYHVEVEESSAGWVWKAWRRGKHEGTADLQGGPEQGWPAAILAVKASLAAQPG